MRSRFEGTTKPHRSRQELASPLMQIAWSTKIFTLGRVVPNLQNRGRSMVPQTLTNRSFEL